MALSIQALAVLEPSSPKLKTVDHPGVLALGAVIVCNLEADVVALAEAYSCHSLFPWCPILVVAPPRLRFDPRVLEAFEPSAGVQMSIVSDWATIESDPEPLRRAVALRSLPSSAMIAGYVRRRTGADVSSSLEACLASGLTSETGARTIHRSTLSRHLKDFGPLKPRDWVAIGHVVQALRLGTLHGIRTVEGVALRAGVDPRTLRARLRRYCACSYAQGRGRLGWEWIVEAALRRFGYVRSWVVGRSPDALRSELARVSSVLGSAGLLILQCSV